MRHRYGFTLIELLVAITIVAIVASIGFITYATAQRNARDARRKQDLRSIATALELYYQGNSQQFPSANVNDSQPAWDTWLPSKYINKMPKDPKGNVDDYLYNYEYPVPFPSPSDSVYVLCAKLENVSDPDITPSGNMPPSCARKNYLITSQ